MKAVFMGTSEFAHTCLSKILESSSVDIKGVYIKPETAHGRSKKSSPVKRLALFSGIPVYFPAALPIKFAHLLHYQQLPQYLF